MIGHESVRAHNNGDCGSLCGICDFEELQEEPELCECGKPLDSFACKIRHQGQPIIRWGKASKE